MTGSEEQDNLKKSFVLVKQENALIQLHIHVLILSLCYTESRKPLNEEKRAFLKESTGSATVWNKCKVPNEPSFP